MPAREPTYYRWAEDKPCTTNQTYGFELRHDIGNGCVRCNACKACAAEAAAAAAAAAERDAAREARRQQREMAGNRRADASAGCQSERPQCKPINRGYTMGPVPITKRLKAAALGGGRRRGGGGGGSTGDQHDPQSTGKDLYLWHALSGTLVYCKNDEECDE